MVKKILVVDDEGSIRNLLDEAFSRKGYQVVLAENAEKALEILGQEHIQVIFLDLKLPGMNGVDLCRQIKEERPIVIIYAMTGFTSLFQLSDSREVGFDDYFTKPFRLQTMLKAAEEGFEKLARWKQVIT